ncbi:MAG: hypothetical protein CVV27_14710 [Candidatus Melainabacteria bacterium HGW-Melainabacteria-1]|nr:MAG: hypothetical protein CVV27_14710 [Candidatus Melainabacteria bacterium HGW-Melainabacteria-1]
MPVSAAALLRYDLSLDLDVDASTLRGQAVVHYTNPGPRELKSLFFRLDANREAQMEVQEVKTKDGLVLPAKPYAYEYLEQQVNDPYLYQVFLPDPLKSGESTELHFRYQIRQLPHQKGSFYLVDDRARLGLGSWYPRLVPFRDGNWQIFERVPADYKVAARASKKLYVISPLAPVSINNTDRSYTYTAENATEMSLIYTPDLLLRSTDEEGMSIRFYYDSSLQKWAPMTLEILNSALRFLRERYSAYPLKRLTVVSVEDSPYPVVVSDQLIVLRNTFAADSDEDLVRRRLSEHLVYALGQQYWGYQVAQPPEQMPWITQGMSLFLAQNYMAQQEKKPFLMGEALSREYLRAARQGWNTSLAPPRTVLERMPYDSFEVLAQGKGYTIMRQLERLLGKPNLIKAETQLLQQYRGRPLTPEAMQQALEQVSGKELEWFFLQWVRRGDNLDYAVQSVQQTAHAGGVKATIHLQRIGKITMPVSIALRLDNGETVLKLWDGTQASDRLVVELKRPLREVIIDPSEATPDVNRANNRTTVSPLQGF